MVPTSPTNALGPHAQTVRDVLVEVIRSRHNRFADAHQVAGTRYSMAFGSQWRDLLDDTNDAMAGRGFQAQKLTPAGYKIPVVIDVTAFSAPSVPSLPCSQRPNGRPRVASRHG